MSIPQCNSWFFTLFAVLLMAGTSFAATPDAGSKAQRTLDFAAQQQKFTFVLFYKQNDTPTQAMAKTISDGLASRADRAVAVYVNVSDPAEKGIVEHFGVSRAPMPFLLAVAPNGAISCVFPQKIEDANLDAAFITPTMARVMKLIQGGKLVLLCVRANDTEQTPGVVREFQADPQFSNRISVVSMQLTDPAETRFLGDLKINPATTRATTVVFMAPPGVLIGKYSPLASKVQLAADLHAAGRCCDDPNCQHHKK